MERTLIQFKDDIVGACDKIANYIQGHTFESFIKDTKIYEAVLMNLIIIGEASTHFPNEIRERNPEIRWTSVVGLRNFLTHEYFEIDPKKVWTTATIHVPELKKQIGELWLK